MCSELGGSGFAVSARNLFQLSSQSFSNMGCISTHHRGFNQDEVRPHDAGNAELLVLAAAADSTTGILARMPMAMVYECGPWTGCKDGINCPQAVTQRASSPPGPVCYCCCPVFDKADARVCKSCSDLELHWKTCKCALVPCDASGYALIGIRSPSLSASLG